MIFLSTIIKYLCVGLIFCVISASISTNEELSPPTIDISPLINPKAFPAESIQRTKDLIRHASEKWGFYNIINHNISMEAIQRIEDQMRKFFALPKDIKHSVRRTSQNSRGFADDEYTKQIVDLKEVYDFGQIHPYSEADGMSANAIENQNLDGVNQWLEEEILPDFRVTIEEFYNKSYQLSNVLMNAIIDSLEECFLTKDAERYTPSSFSTVERFPTSQAFFDKHFSLHTTLFRLNYYPITTNNVTANDISDRTTSNLNERLGISRHTDAGAITLLLQDLKVSSLEVYSGTKQDEGNGKWVPVTPVANAITINSGDMLQVWTNNRFKAPEHRVRATKPDSPFPRYSIAFFLNPNYDSVVMPYPCESIEKLKNGFNTDERPHYAPIRWGDFRSLRYLGDYADIGEEIQIEKYRIKDH